MIQEHLNYSYKLIGVVITVRRAAIFLLSFFGLGFWIDFSTHRSHPIGVAAETTSYLGYEDQTFTDVEGVAVIYKSR